MNKTLGAIIALEILSASFLLSYRPTIPLQAPVVHDVRAAALARFFAYYKCPAPTHINDYINASDKENTPYELLPAISVKESTCGKHYLGNNFWGWGSARIHFESVRAGIDYVSHQLAAGSPYAGLSTFAKLQAYGPHDRFDPKTGKWLPSVTYAPSVMSLINQIDSYEQQYQTGLPARP